MPSGRHKSGKTTMQDIADRLGISKVSVSKAMSGKPGISDALRGRIFDTAREMGYDRIPQESARRFAFVVSRNSFWRRMRSTARCISSLTGSAPSGASARR